MDTPIWKINLAKNLKFAKPAIICFVILLTIKLMFSCAQEMNNITVSCAFKPTLR